MRPMKSSINKTNTQFLLFLCTVVILIGCSAETIFAGKNYLVTNTNSAGSGSFRQAVLDANANPNSPPVGGVIDFDTIEFDTAGVFATPQVIDLGIDDAGLGYLTIEGYTSIVGPGPSRLTIQSGGGGWGVLLLETARYVKISGITFRGGGGTYVGYSGGGAIHVADARLDMEECKVEGNSAEKGGAFFVGESGTLALINSEVTTNSAQEGGGIYLEGGTVSLESSKVHSNTSTGNGAGIFAASDSSVGSISSEISGNTSYSNGGGLYLGNKSGQSSSLYVTDTTFSRNEAVYGGGIYVDSSEAAPYVSITGGRIDWNRAVSGGGIYFHSNLPVDGGITRIDGTEITSNVAEINGGGIYHTARLGNSGGNLLLGGYLRINNSTFSENEADAGYGAVALLGYASITNSTFSSNRGTAIYGGTVLINFSTITGNWNGGLMEGQYHLRSSIIAGNWVVDLDTDKRLEAYSSLIQNAQYDSSQFTGADNIFGEDALLGPLQDNGGPTKTHALLPGSPAIDSGGSTTVPTILAPGLADVDLTYDQRGESYFRASGSGSDIGAFEVLIPDVTPPVITPEISGTLGSDGWYTSDVSVTWSVYEGGSLITSQTGCEDQLVSTDTGGVTFTCSASSAGGADSQTVTIKRDTEAPTLNPAVSPDPVIRNAVATATANASDSLSGISSESCDPVDTSVAGIQSITCTATDNAGNSASQDVEYEVTISYFAGFFQPVENLPLVNEVKAGQTIPLKFSLGGYYGMDIFAPGYPATSLVPCDAAEPSATLEESESSGNSGLTYDPDTDVYKFNWKTSKSAKGSCQIFVIKLLDGSEHYAKFRFK